MDIYAFRVIVHDADTCYRALGQMHSLYKPRPGRMKDYIAIPGERLSIFAHLDDRPSRRPG